MEEEVVRFQINISAFCSILSNAKLDWIFSALHWFWAKGVPMNVQNYLSLLLWKRNAGVWILLLLLGKSNTEELLVVIYLFVTLFLCSPSYEPVLKHHLYSVLQEHWRRNSSFFASEHNPRYVWSGNWTKGEKCIHRMMITHIFCACKPRQN